MKVELISCTPDAKHLLLFTKQTRLNMTPGLLDEIRAWPEEKKTAELDYMTKTIPSSHEFVDVTFLLSGVSRAVAQQITRTRNASFAMQSQRVTDVSDMEIVEPEWLSANAEGKTFWDAATRLSINTYKRLTALGMPLEDARGLLPMNMTCNIVAKYNLRSFVDLMKTRSSLRAQGEYGRIAVKMKVAVLNEWPWAAPFFDNKHDTALRMLEEVAKSLGMTTGKGPAWEIAKAIDLIRKN